jgi:hypothetical protein
MWCHNCGQDVPCAASPQSGKRCCLRCGGPLEDAPAECRGEVHAPADTLSKPLVPDGTPIAKLSGLPGEPPAAYDGWDMDEQLRHIGRVLGKPSTKVAPRGKPTFRFDQAHATPPDRHGGESRPTRRQRKGSLGDTALPLLSGVALMTGLTALVCGGVLLGWSWHSGRSDLWTIGLPIASAGAVGLLLAFILQLDRLGSVHRQTVAKLDRVDDQLHQLRTATTLLGTAHHSPAGAFYSHLADGASPQLLLTDLKSQLDLLALRLSQECETGDE